MNLGDAYTELWRRRSVMAVAGSWNASIFDSITAVASEQDMSERAQTVENIRQMGPSAGVKILGPDGNVPAPMVKKNIWSER